MFEKVNRPKKFFKNSCSGSRFGRTASGVHARSIPANSVGTAHKIVFEFIQRQTFIIFEIFVPNIGPDSKRPARRETYILPIFQEDQSRIMPTKKSTV
jgi:hypothetical protein